MKHRYLFLFFILAICLTACGAKPAASAGSIEIYDPWARTATSGNNTGLFMVIKNTGSQADKLIKVEFTAAMEAGLHQTTNDNGTMKMSPVDAIEIPAGGQTELKSGSYHIMFMKLAQDLKEGTTVPVKLTFEKAGTIALDAAVRKQ